MFATSSKNDTSQNQAEIRTFVFLDLETTGLCEGSRKPKITEISLIATSRDCLFSKDGSLPRVMHKLIILLQPLRAIPLITSQITGLYNDLLENEQPFDDHIYQMLTSFVSRLQPPVCFVAHNGDQFDYPILSSELNRIGRSLSEDILCIDSLVAFKTLFLHTDDFNNCEESFKSESVKKKLKMLNDGSDAALAEIDFSAISSEGMEGTETMGDTYELSSELRQKLNEKTPTHQIIRLVSVNRQKVNRKADELTVKKRLPFTRGKPVNFKLATVYEHLVGQAPPTSHTAECDCLSLLMCAIKIGNPFIRWADQNASPFVRFQINK